MKSASSLKILRIISLVILLLGAISSLYFVFNAGRNNSSALLRLLFIAWVLSPFVACLFFNVMFNRQAIRAYIILYWFTIILSIVSFIFYSGIIIIPNVKNAFIYLVVPFVSWLLIGIVRFIINKSTQKI